ncbi:DDE-type integrase/transposase/recombinase [Rhodovastum atsumiense]|uniref:DDE-type integrase/transposase/recombinase n=1 Tax=Rhodovastum atsumiense TaxID=504468 RepID=UPI0038D12FCE
MGSGIPGRWRARSSSRQNAPAASFRPEAANLTMPPKRLITDGLRSYGVAHREILPEVKHRSSRYLNNRAENSYRPAYELISLSHG